MTDLRTAAQQALEALTASNDLLGTMYLKMDAITALRAALAQQAEPVAWLYPEGLEALRSGKCWTAYGTKQGDNCDIPVYLNGAVAQTVEPAKAECAGFDSQPAPPAAQQAEPMAVPDLIGMQEWHESELHQQADRNYCEGWNACRGAVLKALAQKAEPTQTPCDIAEDGVCEVIDCCRNPKQAEPVACLIGTRSSAFDLPTTRRAYTYAEQPGNVAASKLGRALETAKRCACADSIDGGLVLLKALQSEGFGVFQLGAEYTAPPQRKPLTDEEINALLPSGTMTIRDLVRSIERAHGIGGDDGQI